MTLCSFYYYLSPLIFIYTHVLWISVCINQKDSSMVAPLYSQTLELFKPCICHILTRKKKVSALGACLGLVGFSTHCDFQGEFMMSIEVPLQFFWSVVRPPWATVCIFLLQVCQDLRLVTGLESKQVVGLGSEENQCCPPWAAPRETITPVASVNTELIPVRWGPKGLYH